jgi:zinc transporter, ZIP family
MEVAAYALIPAGALLVCGAVTLLRPPGERLRSAILHFAAGVIFATVGTELLPDVLAEHARAPVVVGFSLGIAVMLGVKSLARRFETSSTASPEASPALRLGAVLGVGVDLAIDGLLLGIGFSAGARVGVLLTVGLAAELASLGVAMGTMLAGARAGGAGAPGVLAGLGVVFWFAAVAAAALLRGVSPGELAGVLAFGIAALLYLVTEELLVEAHEREDTPLLAATFFAGFLAFLLLGMGG